MFIFGSACSLHLPKSDIAMKSNSGRSSKPCSCMKGGRILTEIETQLLVVSKDRGSTHTHVHTHSEQELSATVNGRDKETDSHQAGVCKWLCWTGAGSTAALECIACLVRSPVPVRQWNRWPATSSHPHTVIHFSTPPLPPLGLGLNRPAFLTTSTQWSECTEPSGEMQSVCETERHKCRFGCASCKTKQRKAFHFFFFFLASLKCLAWFGWVFFFFPHFAWPTSHCEPLPLFVVGVISQRNHHNWDIVNISI